MLLTMTEPANVMKIGMESTANTTVENVNLYVMDVTDQMPVTVPAVYQMPSVTLAEIVSANQTSGRCS